MKRNPYSVATVNTIRLLEWVVATIAVLAGGGVVEVALAFLTVRLLGNFIMWMIINRSGSFLRIGIRHASLKTIKKLLHPSLASMCFPLGLSFTMQGFILLIGSMFGPASVALFSIYRTFTRVPIQLATAINQAVWPELSYAFGTNDISKAKKLVVKMLHFGAILSVSIVLPIYFLGERVIDLWVSRALEHNSQLLIALTLTALIHILWQPFWVAQIAINKHVHFALSFLFISALSLVLGWFFLVSFDLKGSGYAILLCELLMAIAAFVTYSRYFYRGPA